MFGVFVAVFASKVAMKSAGAEASSVSQWMVPPLHAGECSRIKENESLSVMPTHPTIVKFIRKNRLYKSMLPVGVRI